jgi:hypothetical protein
LAGRARLRRLLGLSDAQLIDVVPADTKNAAAQLRRGVLPFHPDRHAAGRLM